VPIRPASSARFSRLARRWRTLAYLTTLTLLASCGTLGGARPPGVAGRGCANPSLAPGIEAKRISFEFGGRTRSYFLHVPAGVSTSQPNKLVLNFHGLNSGPLEQLAFTGFNVTADGQGFLVAYPEAMDASWNGGDCCPPASERNIDDVGFARAVVQDISSQICVDADRVYAAGFSNGGIFTHRLACEASDVFAATASVAGGLFLAGCAPSRAVPVLSIHGTSDDLVAFSIAESSTRSWRQLNGCSQSSATEGRCSFHDDCRESSEVGLCTLPDVDHCWPGQALCPKGKSTSPLDFSSNVEIMRFFDRHVRSRR